MMVNNVQKKEWKMGMIIVAFLEYLNLKWNNLLVDGQFIPQTLLAIRQTENHNSASIPVYLLLNDVSNPPHKRYKKCPYASCINWKAVTMIGIPEFGTEQWERERGGGGHCVFK